MKVHSIRFTTVLLVIGGLLWVFFGIRLANSPPGIPSKEIYRNSVGAMPWLSIGMLFITIGVAFLYRIFALRKGIVRLAFIFIQIGGVLYFIGHSLRQFLNGGWEPAAPIGFILIIIGMFIFGLRSIKLKFFPHPSGYLILLSSLCLLFFNDQFLTAWMSVPFGLIWIAISGLLLKSRWRKNANQTIG
ncbi:hypothetical protein [Neobacillus niacini]|uniref:hypothetical protein n=1 Tax=Neobacillus niacini TaxID=86668 RepID=UPI002863B86D|nr:hypothetical protein [Neobacillus niacini]MDR7002606.1 putative membrane channel-forming protein YqfA (hemolysin III family) [Neobacillus niacini]